MRTRELITRESRMEPHKPAPIKFTMGRLLVTPGAMAALNRSHQEPSLFLGWHCVGNWGELCAEDRATNERALVSGGRIMSVYKTLRAETIWVITEGDRSATTLLLPEEY